MSANKITVIDIINSLSQKERSKVLAMLQKQEPTPCSRLGHKYQKSALVSAGFWSPTQIKYICSKCGDSFTS